MLGLGLFRRKEDRVGLSAENSEALGPDSSAGGRLGAGARLMEFELDLLMGELAAVCDDFHVMAGRSDHQRFTEQKPPHLHYRCISEVRFYETDWWPEDVAFYLEHPESRRLLCIVSAIRDRRCNGRTVVWVSGQSQDPFVLRDGHTMYVSDEPDVVGKTIEEVRSRYG